MAMAWKKPYSEQHNQLMKKKLLEWRKEQTIVRVEKPTRIDRARKLGYKAKQGVIVLRVKVRKGGSRKIRPVSGRRPKRMGVTAYTPGKSLKLIAEERAQRKYPNLVLLGSYYVGEDGTHKWFEVIMVDRDNPVIQNDPKFKWTINSPSALGRPSRGLTMSGKKVRGLIDLRGLKETHNHKWKKKEKERALKKRHEANRHVRYFSTRKN
jgi:large subunit ribosomal protein L15e